MTGDKLYLMKLKRISQNPKLSQLNLPLLQLEESELQRKIIFDNSMLTRGCSPFGVQKLKIKFRPTYQFSCSVRCQKLLPSQATFNYNSKKNTSLQSVFQWTASR